MKASETFWEAFWSGIAVPGMVFVTDTPRMSRVETTAASGSGRDSMRSDWVKIGQDFNVVIQREK